MQLSFRKMNGAGNDFVVFDGRENSVALTREQVRKIAARDNPVTKGCDQVIVMEPSQEADVFMRIYNADGGEVDACGNATRCVGWLVMEGKNTDTTTIRTTAAMLHCKMNGNDQVTVNMGDATFDWRDIPFIDNRNPFHTGIRINDALANPVAIGMGNPHAVFFVRDAASLKTIDMAAASQALQPYFPQGVNVSVAYLRDTEHSPIAIDMRVFERGAGETPACGTAACAVMAAAWMRHPIEVNKAQLRFQPSGQILEVEWLKGEKPAMGQLLLTGAVELEFSGELAL